MKHPFRLRPTLRSLLATTFKLLLGVMAILGFGPQSQAALLAHEGFDYVNDSGIGGQFGGLLWTNAWAGGSAGNLLATNTAGSLSYIDSHGHTLQTVGGSLLVGVASGPSATTATPNRTLNYNLSGGTGTVPGPGETIWISVLYKRLGLETGGAPYFRQANLGLFQGTGERLSIGGPNTSATIQNLFSVWGNGAVHSVNAPFQSASDPLLAGATTFILVKIVTDNTTAADTAYIWFNWQDLATEPADNTADIVDAEVDLSGVNNLRFQAGNQNSSGTNAAFLADEIRVGTSFADVAPYSAAGTAPSISADPQNLTVTTGNPASFTVAVNGDSPLRFQWYLNPNTARPNATNATFSIANATTNDAGGYFVIVTNNSGAVTSSVATLTVLAPVPAEIIAQPDPFTNVVGLTANFSVSATGTAPLRYQWYLNTNTILVGQTNATLSFTIQSTNDAGTYRVIVTNNYAAVTSATATLTVNPASPAGLPAFPGADGAAKFITGGRGGIVYHVTKLDRNFNHNEAGTLRYGLNDGNFPPGVPRTIVFNVAGTFWLGRFGAESNHFHGWDSSSRYNLSGNTTIAGQTAPGPVIIAGGVTKPSSLNTIVRNITFAPSYGMRSFEDPPALPAPGDFPDSYVFDALDISGQNILLDHLTCIYGTDETISCNELAANLTIQYCTIAQGENYPQADAENPGVFSGHALGSLLQAGSNAKISILNNLYAHLKGRLPRVGSEVGTGAINDFRNNVFYNWLGTAGSGASGQPSFNNFINNFYLAGPGGDDTSSTNIITSSGGTGIFSGADATLTRVYQFGNFKDTNKDGVPAANTALTTSDFGSSVFQASAYDVNIGVTLSAAAGFTNTLRYAGARWWTRGYDFTLGNTNAITTNDIAAYVDQRLVKETATGTGRIIAWADDPFDNSSSEGVEWRSLMALRADPVTFNAPFSRPANWDTDGDGMPDAWEIERGLNPNTPNNNADFDRDGYTDLEEYLNELAAWPAPGNILFTGNTNSRFAEIFNWQVTGQALNISGQGTVTTASLWQPSRLDTAVISNRLVVVDAVGQSAGTLRLTNGAALAITNGWLSVANQLLVGSGCTVSSTAGLRVTNNLINQGTLRLTGNATLFVGGSFTNAGTLDVMTWNGTIPFGLVNTGTILDRSALKITAFDLSGTNFNATIQGYVGHHYQLQYSDNLTSGTWQNIGTSVPGSGTAINFLHAGGGGSSQRLYRVAISP